MSYRGAPGSLFDLLQQTPYQPLCSSPPLPVVTTPGSYWTMLFRVACLTLGALATADGFVVRILVHVHPAAEMSCVHSSEPTPLGAAGSCGEASKYLYCAASKSLMQFRPGEVTGFLLSEHIRPAVLVLYLLNWL